MNRRDALKTLGAAALAQLSAADLLALGRETHAGLRERYVFESLDRLQNETVDVVSELIIPATDTPGAKAARVNEFIDVMLTNWFTSAERERFLAGLASLDDDDRRFVSLSEEEQVAVLTNLEREALDGSSEAAAPADGPFFSVMKWMTLYGYYTSKVGMEEELHHQLFHGAYEGCAASFRR